MASLGAAPTPFARQLAHQYGLDEVPASRAPGFSLDMASMQHAQPHLFVLDPLPAEDAFVVSVELARAGSRRFFQGNAQTHLGLLEPGAVHIADLAEQPSAYVCSPFHSLLFRLPRATMDDFARDSGGAPIAALDCVPGVTDPVLAGIAAALLPALERPAETCQLFLDHMALALCAHLASTYAGERRRPAATVAGLAPWQARRAKELLAGNLARHVSLAEVAAECGLSRGHFSKAFKATTGQSPHAWLIERRIEAARQMLQASTASLSEIAIGCGFADQSHLTRVFGARTGSSPAQWRRLRRH
jgi:AraC-like DNA-binding protein